MPWDEDIAEVVGATDEQAAPANYREDYTSGAGYEQGVKEHYKRPPPDTLLQKANRCRRGERHRDRRVDIATCNLPKCTDLPSPTRAQE